MWGDGSREGELRGEDLGGDEMVATEEREKDRRASGARCGLSSVEAADEPPTLQEVLLCLFSFIGWMMDQLPPYGSATASYGAFFPPDTSPRSTFLLRHLVSNVFEFFSDSWRFVHLVLAK